MKLFFRTDLFNCQSFKIAFWGQSVSFIGSWIHLVGLSWLAFQLTRSPLGLGLVGFSSTIPSFLFSFLSGITADKFSRLKILVISQFANFLLSFLLGLLSTLKVVNFYEVLILSFGMGIFSNMELPSRQALFLSFLPDTELKRAIAINGLLFNLAKLIGPAAAAFLIPLYGSSICFFINSLSYGVSILSFIIASSKNQKKEKTISKSNLKKSFFSLIANPLISYPALLLGIVTLFGWSYSVLLPYVSSHIYNKGSQGLSLFYSASGLGAIIATLIITFYPNLFSSLKLRQISIIIFCLCLFLFSFFPPFYISLFLITLLGFGLSLFIAATTMILQERIAGESRGMVFGLSSFFFQGFFGFGNLLMGTVAQFAGVRLSLLLSSIICFVAFLFFERPIRIQKQTLPIN
ncbi:MFS transporter [Methylacidiphilum caldifontis]|uniref:MFS transporter permease n=1 Tax=Methylacidiphilum caldifontis TaxID=2795386 RepID=A0A4Y8PBV8_9BACT|nr:MFS transporter [Methylacidiphilum caldifontis]QSR89035.1 MFS transporter [Methylacidiphilum caldifontis]TFE68630.1 MFS transporter permease [Methylacidiphilum caldifontis]